jgi:DNA repair protein RAD50
MKPHANHVSRMKKDISRLKDEISNSESELSFTGSVRTPDDVQMELDAVVAEMYVTISHIFQMLLTIYRRANERDKNTIFSERERQANLNRSIENDIHTMRLRETEIANKIRDKTALEQRAEADKKDLVVCGAKLKVFVSNLLQFRCSSFH